MDRTTAANIILFMGLIGLAIAGYQTYEHHVLGIGGCEINEFFSCATVTGSQYGEFPPNSGIATSAWGIPWWIAVIALSGAIAAGTTLLDKQEEYLFYTALAGTGFVAYLLMIEFVVLPLQNGELAICIFCTAQHVLILSTLYLSTQIVPGSVRDNLPF